MQQQSMAPLAEGPYSEAPQIQIVQQVPLLPLGTTVLSSAAPGGRPTLVVDTGEAAMAQQGFDPLPAPARPMQARSQPRNGTRKAPRESSFGSAAPPPPPPSANTRVTVQKLG